MNTDFQDQDLGYEGWDCPTCLRPMEEQDDHECGTCGMNASHHISVTAMCKIMRRTQERRDREHALADRLAEILQRIANEDYRGNRPHHCVVAECGVKAWKEARSE